MDRSVAGAMAALVVAAMAGTAHAGGYDTGERDWDFLFQQANVAFEASTRQIVPDRTLKNINGALGPSINADEASALTLHRLSATARLGENLRCMVSYRQPWAGNADYGRSWTYASAAVEQRFSSEDYGLTCALGFQAETGIISLVGGVSHQEISYELTQFNAHQIFGGSGRTRVSGSAMGWRAGLAYEIPEYALRASLIYNSAMEFDMDGTVSQPSAFGYSGDASGSITMPQSAELKLQSGIAPGWLAFASLKWTDWSVADAMPLCAPGTPVCNFNTNVSGLVLQFEDSWTATIGLAHQFNEMFSVAGSLTWDQGATNGFTSQTDTWVAGLAAILTPSEHVEFRLSGTMGLMEGGHSTPVLCPAASSTRLATRRISVTTMSIRCRRP